MLQYKLVLHEMLYVKQFTCVVITPVQVQVYAVSAFCWGSQMLPAAPDQARSQVSESRVLDSGFDLVIY